MKNYEKGSVITGKVTGIESYGVFVSVDDDCSGLIHISELSNGFVKNVGDYAKIGERIRVQIIENDKENNRLKLSIKRINDKKTRGILQETGEGFKPLKDNLDKWIGEYNNK